MELTDFAKRELSYIKKAKGRVEERLNLGGGRVDDMPFHVRVMEEMVMDLIERVEKIEELYKPAPATTEVEPGEVRKPRFTLG